MTTPNEEFDDKAMEKMLEDIKLDDYHYVIKFGRKREDNPDK